MNQKIILARETSMSLNVTIVYHGVERTNPGYFMYRFIHYNDDVLRYNIITTFLETRTAKPLEGI